MQTTPWVPSGRVGIVVSRYAETVTARLLEGARTCLRERGVPDGMVDVVWVPGAWELPFAVRTLAARGGYQALVALGAVIRGETPHFGYVAGEASRGLMDVALHSGLPVGFGLLTCDTLAQALARSGGAAGNKGHEAASAALEVAALATGGDAHPH
jgi:6,7-dimethyl-8-ribityllumazine synthase